MLSNQAELAPGPLELTDKTSLTVEGPEASRASGAAFWQILLVIARLFKPHTPQTGVPHLPFPPARFPTPGNDTTTHQVLRPDAWVALLVPSLSLPSTPPPAQPICSSREMYFQNPL